MIQDTELQSPLSMAGKLGLSRTDDREQRQRAAFNSIRIRLASPDVIVATQRPGVRSARRPDRLQMIENTQPACCPKT